MTTRPTVEATVTSSRHPLALFFDGECCFCNRWVGRVMKADTARRIRFGAKQGATFQQVCTLHPEAAQVDSVVLVRRDENSNESILTHSAAVQAVVTDLPGHELFATILRLTPRPLAEIGYRVISKCRTLIFGRQDICHVVKPADRELFLD